MIIQKWLFKEEQAPIKNKIKRIYNSKTLKKIARENIKMNDKELDKYLAKKLINGYYFINEILKIGFKINVESHNINHASSILTVTPKYPDLCFETKLLKS